MDESRLSQSRRLASGITTQYFPEEFDFHQHLNSLLAVPRSIDEQESPTHHFVQIQRSAPRPELRTQNSNTTHQRPNQCDDRPIIIHTSPVPNKPPSLALTDRIRLLSIPDQSIVRGLHDPNRVRDNGWNS